MKKSEKDSTRSGKDASDKNRNNWYRRCYRRLLVDMHIPDWDESFLAKLDGRQYATAIRKANISSTMLYCNSHVGMALYPSKVGPVHKGIGDADFVGDALTECHRNGIPVAAYYSTIYNNAQFLKHPDWRIKPRSGDDIYKQSRYGVCCPNSPFSKFAVAQTEEICRKYPFDGIFFDMLFWPYLCYCKHCQARFQKEEGRALPTTINWNDRTWMAFQRTRERWMDEHAAELTAIVRKTRPSMTVTHQMSPVLHDWRMAMPFSLTNHCDYTSGDFYGPAAQQSLACKLFESLSQNKPFEFHTSRCLDLRDHVTMKSETRLETQASLAPAHASAFMFIDAIETDGTLNRGVYGRLRNIFSKLEPYEKYLGGDLSSDVALYVSSESRFDFRENGNDVGIYTKQADNMAARFGVPHMEAVTGAARALQETHIPFAVVTKLNLDRLRDYRVILLPNVLVMSDEEIAALRDFVAKGGALYASGYSSLVSEAGTVRKDFGLADVFGVSKQGAMDHELTFFTPADRALGGLVAPQEHIIHKGGLIPIKATTAKIVATVTPPWYPADKGTVFKPSFSSIHSTPPGPTGTEPGITWQRHGKGRVCYAAGAIEAEDRDINRRLVAHLVRLLMGTPAQVEAEAPSYVELTVFEKTANSCLNISLVSLRESDDCLPCGGKVRVRLGKKRRLASLLSLPARRKCRYRKMQDNTIEFEFNDFRILTMFELKYTTT
jgi:hypothetical protein